MTLNKIPSFKTVRTLLALAILCVLLFFAAKGILFVWRRIEENRILKKVVERLSADSRLAEALVTQSVYHEETGKIETTIKFLEYDAAGRPLTPRYFTFEGNLIQFQALVIRFEDSLVRAGDRLRGKSVSLFLKAFVLDEKNPQVFTINEVNAVPEGYKIPGRASEFEKKLWEEFWQYALDPNARRRAGIKNAQIEAPGSLFVPGTIYTIRIEHDGGIRIDTAPLPEILRGEKVS